MGLSRFLPSPGFRNAIRAMVNAPLPAAPGPRPAEESAVTCLQRGVAQPLRIALAAVTWLAAVSLAQAQEAPPRPLEVLRGEIDRVDQDLLRLLNERAGIVAEVGRGKAVGTNPAVFRPGRQAALIRKLAAEPGLQPPGTLARIWTAIIAGSILQQKPGFTVALADGGRGGMALLAQDYFGAQPPLAPLSTPEDALAALTAGRADAAVIAIAGTWWQRLPIGVRVVAAAPFVVADPASPPVALILAKQEPDPSGADRTVMLLPTTGPLPDGAQVLTEAGGTRLVALAVGAQAPAGAWTIGQYAAPLAAQRPH